MGFIRKLAKKRVRCPQNRDAMASCNHWHLSAGLDGGLALSESDMTLLAISRHPRFLVAPAKLQMPETRLDVGLVSFSLLAVSSRKGILQQGTELHSLGETPRFFFL